MAGPIFTQATFHKLGRSLLDDNAYLISRLFAYSGPDKRQCKDCNCLRSGHFGHMAIIAIHLEEVY